MRPHLCTAHTETATKIAAYNHNLEIGDEAMQKTNDTDADHVGLTSMKSATNADYHMSGHPTHKSSRNTCRNHHNISPLGTITKGRHHYRSVTQSSLALRRYTLPDFLKMQHTPINFAGVALNYYTHYAIEKSFTIVLSFR